MLWNIVVCDLLKHVKIAPGIGKLNAVKRLPLMGNKAS